MNIQRIDVTDSLVPETAIQITLTTMEAKQLANCLTNYARLLRTTSSHDADTMRKLYVLTNATGVTLATELAKCGGI